MDGNINTNTTAVKTETATTVQDNSNQTKG